MRRQSRTFNQNRKLTLENVNLQMCTLRTYVCSNEEDAGSAGVNGT